MSRLLRIFNFDIITPLSGNLKLLHFYAIPIRIRYIVPELWAIFKCWKQYKQKNLTSFFANISKTTSATSDSFPLIMSHVKMHNVNSKVKLNHCFQSTYYVMCFKIMLKIVWRYNVTEVSTVFVDFYSFSLWNQYIYLSI